MYNLIIYIYKEFFIEEHFSFSLGSADYVTKINGDDFVKYVISRQNLTNTMLFNNVTYTKRDRKNIFMNFSARKARREQEILNFFKHFAAQLIITVGHRGTVPTQKVAFAALTVQTPQMTSAQNISGSCGQP